MKVLQVSVAQARQLEIEGRQVLTAGVKGAVEGPVAVGRLGLQGDEQADLSLHGGLAKAVYAYPQVHYAFWQTVRAQARVAAWDEPVPYGTLGENLTLEGLAEDRLWIGDYLELPNCVLAVSEPRFPCFKLNAALGFKHAGKLMAQSGYCGSYFTVIEAGSVQTGDAVTLRPGPREVNLRELFFSRARRLRD